VIYVKIIIDHNKIINELKVNGHSNFDKKGKDIVCAAVSILVYTIYLSLKKLPSIKIEYKDDKKDSVFLSLKKYSNELEGEIRGITIFLINGINLLSEKYKSNVKLDLIEN
jgi:hypothetical protein